MTYRKLQEYSNDYRKLQETNQIKKSNQSNQYGRVIEMTKKEYQKIGNENKFLKETFFKLQNEKATHYKELGAAE